MFGLSRGIGYVCGISWINSLQRLGLPYVQIQISGKDCLQLFGLILYCPKLLRLNGPLLFMISG
ncbi:hypothetical protein HanXRQr2_Chr02g0051371 [Helianthus annuus]|uniref:Uncharacterized protein n=1 Tax=Helianthus annuus TaxID=4232 RepID=A0A9K3NYZ9_HELAN|nr:hypothetical protein HanXRQr2_Chr02g0051371 [Helianthus annuus]KAJ0950655.1 hypothetical protein HanPSC8_Chr02g0050821 [Helianthus annuus]